MLNYRVSRDMIIVSTDTIGGVFMSDYLSIGSYGTGYGYGYSSPYQSYSIQNNTNRQTSPMNTAGTQTDKPHRKTGNPEDDTVKRGRKSSPAECQTCKNRKYQDGSDEGDVSFKAPGHISPQASAGTVRAHELQHVSNAYEKAANGNGQVRSVSVSLKTAVCPECGTTYVSGGETRTSIAYSKPNPYQQNKKAIEAMNLIGSNVDYVA